MIRYIEGLSMNAWPSIQTLIYDGWILRFANGYTRRANSVNPIFHSTINVDRKIDKCEQLFKSKNLRIVFKMTAAVFPENLDDILQKRGYSDTAYTSVQVLTLDENEPTFQNIKAYNHVDDNWFADFCRLSNVTEANKSTLRNILEGIILQKFFVSLILDNETIGCGMGVLEDNFIGFFDVIVGEDYRRQGYGEQLMLHLFKLGKNNGAEKAYLQVMQNNTPALKLYSKLGFKEIYEYWYRVKKSS